MDKLIFGCGRLSGGIEEKKSIGLLKSAADAGINKFDIAPCYGTGDTEAILKRTFNLKNGNVKITTKIGLERAHYNFVRDGIKYFLGPTFSIFRRRVVRPQKNSVGNMNVDFLQRSFFDSLKMLGVDCVDTLLLHEPRAEIISDDVLELLLSLKSKGYICQFGTGIGGRFDSSIVVGDVAQFMWGGEDFNCSAHDIRVHGVFRHDKNATIAQKIPGIINSDTRLKIIFSTKNKNKILELKKLEFK